MTRLLHRGARIENAVEQAVGERLVGTNEASGQQHLEGGIEPVVVEVRSLARQFLGLMHRRNLREFDRWLEHLSSCAAPEMQSFAAGLRADLPAVRAAFSSPWSNGQTEGHVNRLTFLKRQMYGRASVELLRLRVLNPN